jgi:hypothetical protein
MRRHANMQRGTCRPQPPVPCTFQQELNKCTYRPLPCYWNRLSHKGDTGIGDAGEHDVE